MSSSAEPLPGRFNRVEREILRRARLGEPADFRTWNADGTKPSVSAKFIAGLWMGLAPGPPVHPWGIGIAGLRVEGQINLGGAKIDDRLRTPLVGFMAEECEFPDGIFIANARVESVAFQSCTFGRPDSAHSAVLDCGAAEVLGQISVDRCELHGDLDLRSSVIDDDVLLAVTCHGAVRLDLAEIRGRLLMVDARCGLSGTIAVSAFEAVIAGTVDLIRCRFAAGVSFSHARAANFLMLRCRISDTGPAPALRLEGMRSDRNLVLRNCRMGGSVNAAAAAVEGETVIHRCMVEGSPGLGAALDFSHSRPGLVFTAQHSRFRGALGLDYVHARSAIRLLHLSVERDSPDQEALALLSARTQVLQLTGCRLFGALRMEAAIVEAWTALNQCSVAGGMTIIGTRTGRFTEFVGCGFGRSSRGWSIESSSLSSEGMVTFASCYCSGAFSGVQLSAQELRIEGCRFGAIDQGARPAIAIWLAEAQVGRRLSFSMGATGSLGPTTIAAGVIDLQNARIGQDLHICSLRAERLAPHARGRNGRILDLSGAEVGGSLVLAPWRLNYTSSEGRVDQPAELVGAVVLDRARIGGDVAIDHGTRIAAVGAILRPAGDSAGENRVRKHKRGVALSMIGADIRSTFDLGSASLSGLVDLRDAHIGQIADGCGRRWTALGLEPGHLLLDGLTYRDLDDSEEDLEGGGEGDPVRRRIDWLAMQYPERRASPATFVPQPYDQLARHFAQNGNERARRLVHVARRDLQRRHAGLPRFERAAEQLLSVTSAYGYAPGRAAAVTAAFVGAGAVAAWAIAAGGGVLAAADAEGPPAAFNPFLYALDVAVPFLDIGQDERWTLTGAGRLPDWAVQIGLAAYRLAGLVLVSITVLTFSGILREKE